MTHRNQESDNGVMAQPMPATFGHFIAGKQVSALSGRVFESRSPASGTIVGYAARGDAMDGEVAVAAAQAAFPSWSGRPPAERERVLLRAADSIEGCANELADLLVEESGATLRKAQFEVGYTASLLRAAAGEARRLYGDTLPNEKPHRMSLVIREPLGVVLAITPFNAPLVLLAKMTAFPLAAGNTVIAKPSEETPLIAIRYAELLSASGVPDGVINVVTGDGPECGEPLARHHGVKGIALTGSTVTGLKVGAIAASSMKRVQLELGGSNPLLVLSDADVLKSAEIAAVGAFYHAGQICMATSRVIVERAVASDLADALTAKARSLPLGDLRDERTAFGPLINARALTRIHDFVATSLNHGAELLTGGEPLRGLTYKPTVLWRDNRHHGTNSAEVFGPVVTIYPVDSLDEAIALANDSVYGLSAGIMTNDIVRGLTAARQILCGAVHLGMHSFQSDALAPIGGFGMSGIGRSGGKYSVEHFTELKWISVELGETARPF